MSETTINPVPPVTSPAATNDQPKKKKKNRHRRRVFTGQGYKTQAMHGRCEVQYWDSIMGKLNYELTKEEAERPKTKFNTKDLDEMDKIDRENDRERVQREKRRTFNNDR